MATVKIIFYQSVRLYLMIDMCFRLEHQSILPKTKVFSKKKTKKVNTRFAGVGCGTIHDRTKRDTGHTLKTWAVPDKTGRIHF